MQPRAFVSYAREDAAAVERLTAALRTLRCDAWLDEALVGGQAWWDEILEHVRTCDVFVCAVSCAMLESDACTAELGYATRLGKPLLPVRVDAMPSELLPPSLARIHVLDFTYGALDPELRLAGAIRALPQAPPLPRPLPAPPPAPVSHLSRLAERARAHDLTTDEQQRMVFQLEYARKRPAERAPARHVAQMLLRRDDLLHLVAGRLEALVAPSWSARLVDSRPLGRTFEVTCEDRTWMVSYERAWWKDRVVVDGREVPKSNRVAPVDFRAAKFSWRFLLPGGEADAPPAAYLLIDEQLVFHGVALIVDGHVLHREGTFA